MSYYKQFAEMLGLELDEEFSLATPNGEKANLNTYKIIEDGIYYESATHDAWWSASDEILGFLLMGEFKAVPKPFKPKINERYWRYQPHNSDTSWSIWCDDGVDFCRWKCGNCFRTEEEARTKGKEIMEALQKEYEES